MNDPDLEALGLRVRTAREAADLSIRELAARVDTHPSFLARVEKGERQPAAEWLQRLAEELHIDLIELLVYIGLKPSSILPEPREYFLRKMGVSEDEADILAGLV